MFSVARVVNRIPRASASHISTRSFAQVVPVPSGSSSLSRRRPQKLSYILREKVPVKEDHGLWGFFRRKENADDLEGEAKYEVVEDPQSRQRQTGRSWKASELRLKSFKDLHTLWYILLRERNLLATQKEEARRMGISEPAQQVNTHRVHHTRKSMARIKAVLNERRLAYEGAIKIVEGERQEKINQDVLNSMKAAYKEKIRHLKKRRAYLAQRRELKLARLVVTEEAVKVASEELQPAAEEPQTVAEQPQRVAGILINS